MSSTSFNIIGPEAKKDMIANHSWTLAASEQLERAITNRMAPDRMNIRQVQPGDNLLRITTALSRRAILPPEIHPLQWMTVPVVYLGISARLDNQRRNNPEANLLSANLIHPGQYVTWASSGGLGRVFVADRIEDLTR